MLFVGLLIAAAIVYIVQMKLFDKYSLSSVTYDVRLSSEEVFEGEDVFMYEELSNNKNFPVPSAKVDSTLPEGLYFRLLDRGEKDGKPGRDSYKSNIESMFVLNGNSTIRRRWRVSCKKRGKYTLGSAMIVTGDLLGLNAISKRVKTPVSALSQVTVLPRAIDLDGFYTSFYYGGGEKKASKTLSCDPLDISGAREYSPADPMSRINWKSTAAHGTLMVNVEERTKRNPFNIVLNMQSRSIEADAEKPGSPQYIEECITVAASLLDKAAGENLSVRLFVNTPPGYLGQASASQDEIGEDIAMTRVFSGRREMIDALRLLASLEMKVSVPFAKMLDHIAENPWLYSGGGNIIVVSPYIDERMLIFHDLLARRGVNVCFFVTTTFQNAMSIPSEVEVHYKSF